MDAKFKFEVHINLPEGSKFSDNQNNLIILPDGRTINVHPVLVLSGGEDEDDHRNLIEKEMHELGINVDLAHIVVYKSTAHKGDIVGEMLRDRVSDSLRQPIPITGDKLVDLSTRHFEPRSDVVTIDPFDSSIELHHGSSIPYTFDLQKSISLSDLSIGDEFVYEGQKVVNRITDIGTRTATYIRLHQEDPRNYNGPPYSIVEHVLDEDDIISLRLIKKVS